MGGLVDQRANFMAETRRGTWSRGPWRWTVSVRSEDCEGIGLDQTTADRRTEPVAQVLSPAQAVFGDLGNSTGCLKCPTDSLSIGP